MASFSGPIKSPYFSSLVWWQVEKWNGILHVMFKNSSSIVRFDLALWWWCVLFSIASCLLTSIIKRSNETSVTLWNRWRTSGITWSIGTVWNSGGYAQLYFLHFGLVWHDMISWIVRAPLLGSEIDQSLVMSCLSINRHLHQIHE